MFREKCTVEASRASSDCNKDERDRTGLEKGNTRSLTKKEEELKKLRSVKESVSRRFRARETELQPRRTNALFRKPTL